MVVNLVLATSVAFQIAAAVLAFRLMRITGRKWSWGLMCAGITLMILRRCLSLYHAPAGDLPFTADLSYELIGLAISFCLLAGLAGISPMFLAARCSEKALRASQERMERLNAVLRATRDINQLAIREKDADALLQGTCRSLVDNGAYRHAWTARVDESGRPIAVAHAGLGNEQQPFREQTERGELTPCVRAGHVTG